MYSSAEDNEFFKFSEAMEDFNKSVLTWEFKLLLLFSSFDQIPILNSYLFKKITITLRIMRELAEIQGMVLDFWIASLETSTATLNWFILLIMKHLDIQEKLQDKIDDVLGRNQWVQLNDRAKMS
uniref:Cytochrome P450 n=1 Tax=Strongyloides venezuelensis TaxID=75913 RepID=A0A0K0EZ48_STRVS